MKKISVSFLTSKDAASDLMKLDRTDVDFVHVDFIDNRFVKGRSITIKDLLYIERYTTKRLDVHLMVRDAMKYLKKIVTLNAEYITFHIESKTDIEKAISFIKNHGIKVGLALSPDTPFDTIKPYLDRIDLILIMTVYPGRGGQTFLEPMKDKLKEIKEYVVNNKLPIVIEVDGGINEETKKDVALADILATGSYVTNSYDFQEAITKLRK